MGSTSGTKSRTEIINTFLKENKLTANDLARYLEKEHKFACFRDDQLD
jgi:hypothetical protein